LPFLDAGNLFANAYELSLRLFHNLDDLLEVDDVLGGVADGDGIQVASFPQFGRISQFLVLGLVSGF
jgi:hypothetical protein